MNFELGGAQVVAVKIIGHNFHRAVIAPSVRIADFISNSMQLDQRLLFGFGTHPIELLNPEGHGVFNSPRHLYSGSFQLGWKRFANIGLPQSFSEIAVNVRDATLPARLLLFGA